jgi:predicted signal transduction protein with EAL and GGDEF domain
MLGTALSGTPGTADDDDFADEALLQFLYRAPIGLIQTTLDGDIEMINPMSVQLLMPLSPDAGIVNLFTATERVAPQLRALVAAFDQPRGVVCESLRITLEQDAAGTSAARVLSISVLKLEPSRLMAVLSDATLEVLREQQRLESRLIRAARTDGLTQMPNRTAVSERIQRSLVHPRAEYEFALLFINCDRFKQINDAHGQAVGDEMLGLMAERVRAALRAHSRLDGPGLRLDPGRAGPMAARIGGDEFVVVLDELRRADDAHIVAQRLVDVLCQPYGIGEAQLHCGVSVGVLLRAQAGVSADDALRDASIAMMEAKRAGGSRYVIFEPPMQERAARRSGMETDLRVALAASQLFVVYQPVIRLAAGTPQDRFAGVEALVRWCHPLRGVVDPLEFIGVAEECGMIEAIGEFVLRASCRQFMIWQRELGPGAPRTLAVNLSRAQLVEPGLVNAVEGILRSTGMPPGLLQLEITESLAAQHETVQARLHELKALGLKLALDDFGTGYSSLSSLHLLPVDTVKIDRSFVTHVESSRHHQVLIEATVRVAHSLGMSTVAEGIETAGQAAKLRHLACDKGQGYLFSKPIAAAEIGPWVEAGTSQDQEATQDQTATRQTNSSNLPDAPAGIRSGK